VAADVVFFGNAAGLTAQLCGATGARAMFGFPAAEGVHDGAVIRYVAISQQKTMLADPAGNRSPRVIALGRLFRGAGFPTHVSVDAEAWLVAHAAFIVRSRARCTALMLSRDASPLTQRC
jgi:ketopantoate reductase